MAVTTTPAGRPPPEIEAAAYFVACEALANAVKHAASSVTISAVFRNASLVIEVSDDGVGGADMARGTGLRGLADRVEAHGGSLRVVSARGGARVGRSCRAGRDRRRLGAAARRLARVLADNGFEVVPRLVTPRRSSAPSATRSRTSRSWTSACRRRTRTRARRLPFGSAAHPDRRPRAVAVRRGPPRADALPRQPGGFGYLLKDRVVELDEFLSAIRRVANGGTVVDPDVVAQLLAGVRTTR